MSTSFQTNAKNDRIDLFAPALGLCVNSADWTRWRTAASLSAWRARVDGRAGRPFLAQEYVEPYRTDTLPPDAGIDELPDAEVPRKRASYNNINGLYLYNGTFAGVFSRLGPLPTISKDMQGMTAATIWVDCEMM